MEDISKMFLIPNTRFLVTSYNCEISEEQPRQLIVIFYTNWTIEILPLMQSDIVNDNGFNIDDIRESYKLFDSITIGKYHSIINCCLDSVSDIDIQMLGEEYFKKRYKCMFVSAIKRLPDIFLDPALRGYLELNDEQYEVL